MTASAIDQNVSLTEIIVLREKKKAKDVNPNSPNPEVVWDYLSLYSQGGTLLARCNRGYASTEIIEVLYRGVIFMSLPTGEVYVEWNSLIDFVETE